MNEENKNLEEDFEFDELDNKIILNDEEGNEIEFEFLDVVEVDGKEYVRIEGSEEDESYVSLDDEAEAEKVFQAFKEKAKDEFDFAD